MTSNQRKRDRDRRQWWREQRQLVGGRLIAPVSAEYHGRNSTYMYYACRCGLCTDAASAYQSAKTRQNGARATNAPGPASTPQNATASRQRANQAVRDAQRNLRRKRRAPRSARVPMSAEVAAQVTEVAEQHAVATAFHEPQFVTPDPLAPEHAERRSAHGTTVVVSGGQVVMVTAHEQSTAEPESLRQVTRGVPRSRGTGGGSAAPTDYAEVLRRIQAAGGSVARQSRHIVVTLPNGTRQTLPRTASDWRAIRNTITQLARAGLDVREVSA